MTNIKTIYQNQWLPTTVKEAKAKGWNNIDVVLFSGDAYIDHPSFGAAVIGRVIESEGLQIAIVPQPNWQDDLRDFKKFGKPNLFFAITAGSMDSMVNHYTASKRKRSNDAYTPGGETNHRPDYTTVVYSQILKKLYPEVPVFIGGIEASLRRFTHYDYWQDSLKPSILVDSKADLLVYGMGEKTIRKICKLMQKNVPVSNIAQLPQIAHLTDNTNIEKYTNNSTIELHSHEDCLKSKTKFAENFKIIETESNKIQQTQLIQPVNNKIVVVNAPEPPMTEQEMDSIWDLPYTRLPHPKYRKKKPIPAYEMIKHSVNSHRGCFGGCAFCTISAHQGKYVVSRSQKSILQEVRQVSLMEDFKGYISDIGGPSANMYKMKGKNLEICKTCKKPSCVFPKICNNLNYDHSELLKLYENAREIGGIKKITIGSGIRYDMLYDNNENFTKDGREYAKQIIKHHVNGRLKVAPEHSEDNVLKIMRKHPFSLFLKFQKFFIDENKRLGLKQQVLPYLISSHPGCTIENMADLSIKIKQNRVLIESIQDFTPTPMTLATVMFYTGLNPYTGKKVTVAKSIKEKNIQRSFFFWNNKKEQQNTIKYLKQNNLTHIIKKISKR